MRNVYLLKIGPKSLGHTRRDICKDNESNLGPVAGYVVAKTEFIHTPTIEIDLNSQIHLVSTSELIENDSLNRKITQAINKSVKITEYQTMNCLPFCVKTYIM